MTSAFRKLFSLPSCLVCLCGWHGLAFGDSSFGQVTSTLNAPRHTQIGVRFEF